MTVDVVGVDVWVVRASKVPANGFQDLLALSFLKEQNFQNIQLKCMTMLNIFLHDNACLT